VTTASDEQTDHLHSGYPHVQILDHPVCGRPLVLGSGDGGGFNEWLKVTGQGVFSPSCGLLWTFLSARKAQ